MLIHFKSTVLQQKRKLFIYVHMSNKNLKDQALKRISAIHF